MILGSVTLRDPARGKLVPYCGVTYRVLKRVTRILDEKTGNMLEMKTPCIILDTVVCEARYSGSRMFCPRSIYPYWREIWLERVEPHDSAPGRSLSQGLDATAVRAKVRETCVRLSERSRWGVTTNT